MAPGVRYLHIRACLYVINFSVSWMLQMASACIVECQGLGQRYKKQRKCFHVYGRVTHVVVVIGCLCNLDMYIHT
ncbi:hypothetical protein F4810DRAFT_678896 [Camillea tinctor]|nr:hypothetical protein F4810DRAFT_678896 [Camillea tinctor]